MSPTSPARPEVARGKGAAKGKTGARLAADASEACRVGV